jgi:menaquinone-dependent protoporphyrinogen oxidase
MKIPVLVIYASKHGATAEIARKIGETLTQAGIQTALADAKTARDLSPYRAIILGSAVYFGSWRKEAAKLLKTNQQILAEKPTWLFSSGPAGEGDPVELLDGWRLPSGLQEIVDRIQPHDITVFHGMVNPDKLNIFEKWILKNVKSPVGDYRNWEAITAWAEEIATSLMEKK